MAYKMNTTKTWAATYRELGEQFQRWGYHRGFHVNWSVENLRGYRDVTLRYQHANEPEVVLTMKNREVQGRVSKAYSGHYQNQQGVGLPY